MGTLNLTISLVLLLIISSCQVKEAASNGGLISGHGSVTNKFTLKAPPSKTYVSGEVLSFVVSFPFNMILDETAGSPRLALTIGSTTQYAIMVSQANLKELHFNYMISPGENDSNGIDVTALDLNGSTIKFDNAGTLTDCDVTTITSKNLLSVKIDTASPLITNLLLVNPPGLYNAGKKIYYSMTFDEKVYVTGLPKFLMSLSGASREVSYVSGTGSTNLVFTYSIGPTDSDSNGYDSLTSPLDVGAGSIKDAVGNNANLDFSSLIASVLSYSTLVKINGQLPFIVNMVVPANGTYIAAQTLEFTLEFDRIVNVTGVPQLNIIIGANTRQAVYLSGTGSKFLTFNYTAVPGDVDLDGISITESIIQNSSNIVDATNPAVGFFDDPLNNHFAAPNTTGVILNAIQPQPISAARNADVTNEIFNNTIDNVWIIGQELLITIGFNTGIYVNQGGGTPTLQMTIGATQKEATYLSGGNGQTSLIFKYTVAEGDLDTDGTIALGNIVLNGATLVDSANTNSLLTLPNPNNTLTSTKIDAVRPTVSSVSTPANGTYSTQSGVNHLNMTFNVNWSEPVSYSSTASGAVLFNTDIGGVLTPMQYFAGDKTATIIHRAVSLATLNDSDGIVVQSPLSGTAQIKDQAGNLATNMTFTPPVTSGILVDTIAPTVTLVTPLNLNGTYKAGESLDFSVTFSEPVTTNVSANYPRIPVTIGTSTKYLVATANTTSTTHTFRYTITSGDTDTNGIVIGNAVQHNGATQYARDAGRNNSVGTFTLPDTSGINVDAIIPTISNAVASAAKSYVSGETISISVTFSETMYVTGSPLISLDFDLGVDDLVYTSGSGTTTLVFSRLIDSTHFDMNGLPSVVTGISLNGGTILDAGRNPPSSNLFPSALNLSSHFITYPEVKLWAKNNFVNIAPSAGAVSVISTGAVSTEPCGIGTCRTFDGDDSFSLTSPLVGVETVFLVFKTPASVAGGENFDLFDVDLTLKGDQPANAFDLSTANGNLWINALTLSGVNHDTNLPPGTTNVLQLDFTASQNYSAQLIDSPFTGAIGEILAIEGTLTSTQKDNIRNYLVSRY